MSPSWPWACGRPEAGSSTRKWTPEVRSEQRCRVRDPGLSPSPSGLHHSRKELGFSARQMWAHISSHHSSGGLEVTCLLKDSVSGIYARQIKGYVS